MTVLSLQFALIKTQKRARTRLLTAISNYTTDDVSFSENALAQNETVSGSATSVLMIYADAPVRLVLTVGATVLDPLTVKGLTILPSPCDYAITNLAAGPDAHVYVTHD